MPETTPSAGTLVQYVNEAEALLTTVRADTIPRQTDWIHIDGTDFKVYDVVHTVEMSDGADDDGLHYVTVLVWEPDPEYTSDDLDALIDRTIAVRAGERTWTPSGWVTGTRTQGERMEVIHDETLLTTVRSSILPKRYEGVLVDDTAYVAYSMGHEVMDGQPTSGFYLMDESAKDGLQMHQTHHNLRGQRDNARTRVLDEEGSDAYEALMERVDGD